MGCNVQGDADINCFMWNFSLMEKLSILSWSYTNLKWSFESQYMFVFNIKFTDRNNTRKKNYFITTENTF